MCLPSVRRFSLYASFSDIRPCLTTALNYSLFILGQEEYYSTHTSPTAPAFYDCVIKGHPASRGQGPLSESRFKEIWVLVASAEIKERAKKDVEEVISKFKIFSCPWIVAYKVPLDDRPLSREEKLKNPMECTDYQSFFGPDRMVSPLPAFLSSMPRLSIRISRPCWSV
jgi:hypothetical protein